MGGWTELSIDWRMIGRDEELAFIGDRIAAGDSGVLLTGAAGTGKSRLGREAVAAAEAAGHRTDTIVCTQATAEVPFLAISMLADAGSGTVDRTHSIMESLRSRPDRTVLLIDDIDHLDRRSMAVVHQATGEGLVFLLATARTTSQPNADVIALWKDLGLVQAEIQALSRTEVATMLRDGLGGEVDGLAIKDIWRVAAGVPLYVRELVQDAVRQGILVSEREVWILRGSLPTPASLVDLVRSRLVALTKPARDAADFIGAAEMLPVAVLEDLASAAAIDELESVGVVAHAGDLYQLTHPVFGEVVRQSMTSARRRDVMARLADEIEQRGMNDPGDVIRAATWRLAAGIAEPTELMSEAAYASYEAGDFELARQLAEAADRGGSAEGALLLGQILHETGEHDAAEQINVRQQLSEAEPSIQQRAIIQRSVNLFFGLGRGHDALTALDASPDPLPYNRAWFLLNMARIDEAAGALPDGGDNHLRLVTSAWIAALAGRADEGLALLDQLPESGDEPSIAPSRFRDFPDLPRTLALIETGRLSEAKALAEVGHETSIEEHPAFIRAWWLFMLGRIHTDLGEMATAASYFHQGEVLQASINQPGLRRWFLGGSAYARSQTGDRAGTESALAMCRSIPNRDEQAFRFLEQGAAAWQQLHSASRTVVVDQLVSAGDQLEPLGALTAARRLWFDAVRLGGARQVGERLESGRSEMDRSRASLASATANSDAASVAEVADFFTERQASLWAAEAWTTASYLFARDSEPRLEAAAARSADAARSRCEGVATPGLIAERDSIPLTDREREVVVMAAGGRASKDIAAALFISVRTVNNLIHRSYVKLGVSSRGEAALALGIDTDAE